jgi:hypothetical protein
VARDAFALLGSWVGSSCESGVDIRMQKQAKMPGGFGAGHRRHILSRSRVVGRIETLGEERQQSAQ